VYGETFALFRVFPWRRGISLAARFHKKKKEKKKSRINPAPKQTTQPSLFHVQIATVLHPPTPSSRSGCRFGVTRVSHRATHEALAVFGAPPGDQSL
jgi:hypothetical protein